MSAESIIYACDGCDCQCVFVYIVLEDDILRLLATSKGEVLEVDTLVCKAGTQGLDSETYDTSYILHDRKWLDILQYMICYTASTLER